MKIVTRVPKPRDIGVIFDVTLKNSDEEDLEPLKFRIRSDGYCYVNATPQLVIPKMGRIVGGDFGFIKPGDVRKVSLIWPTASLYNRIGFCPILITSTNPQNIEHSTKQIVKFDTRFENLDPNNRTLRKYKDFVDCKNWDKDYFKNCTPIDCGLRYFGLLNFFNKTSEKCEKIPVCLKKYYIFDIFSNECIDPRVILSKKDLKALKAAKLKFRNKKQSKLQTTKPPQEKPPARDYTNLFAQDYLEKRGHLNPFQLDQLYQKTRDSSERAKHLKGLGEGLLIVLATIAIYLLICFGIFLIVSCCFVNGQENTGRRRTMVLSPSHLGSSEEIPIITTSSLMSQR